VPAHQLEPLGVHVDGHDRRAARGGELHTESAHAPGADEHRQVALGEARTLDGLERRRHRVGDHRKRGQIDPARVHRPVGQIRHRAQPARGDDDVAREPAVHVVAGEDLALADRSAAGTTSGALAARNHGRDDDRPAEPFLGPVSRLDHGAGDLVAERQRERVAGRDPVVVEAEIGVADPASRHLHQNLPRAGALGSRLGDHRFSGPAHDPCLDLHDGDLSSPRGPRGSAKR